MYATTSPAQADEIDCAATGLAEFGTAVPAGGAWYGATAWRTLMGHHAPIPMDIATALIKLSELHDAAAEIPALLEACRSAYTDEEWEALEEAHPTIAALISACCDIEAAV
jgi:hypothetical protein